MATKKERLREHQHDSAEIDYVSVFLRPRSVYEIEGGVLRVLDVEGKTILAVFFMDSPLRTETGTGAADAAENLAGALLIAAGQMRGQAEGKRLIREGKNLDYT